MEAVLLNEFACMEQYDSRIELFLKDLYAMRSSVAALAFLTAVTCGDWMTKSRDIPWSDTALHNVVHGLAQLIPDIESATALSAKDQPWKVLQWMFLLIREIWLADESQLESIFEPVQQVSKVMAEVISQSQAREWTFNRDVVNMTISRMERINARCNRIFFPAVLTEVFQKIGESRTEENENEMGDESESKNE